MDGDLNHSSKYVNNLKAMFNHPIKQVRPFYNWQIFSVLKEKRFSVSIVLITLFLLALFLRVYRIDVLMRFIWDEGRDMLAIRHIIVDKNLTLFGPFNEIGDKKDFFGVFHYYLMLPSLWLWNFDPVGPAIFTALLGSITVVLSYFWVKHWADIPTALSVGLILAVSPLVVRFNQWPWNPNTIGFFGIIFLLILQRFVNRRSGWLAFVAGITLGLLFQLHYFAVALGGAFLVLLTEKQKVKSLDIILFILGCILPNLTFVIFDLTHEGFYRKIIFESFIGNTQQKFVEFSISSFFLNPPRYLFDVLTQFTGLSILGVIFTFLALIFGITYKKRSLEEKQLIVSWVLFLAMTSFFPLLLNDYHSGALWIGLSIVIVWGIKKLSVSAWQVPLFLLSGFMICSNAFWRQPTWKEGMPRIRNAANAIASDISQRDTSKVNVASLVDSDTRAIRFRYFVEVKNQSLLNVDEYPQTEVLYIISAHDWPEVQKNPAWEIDVFREASQSEVTTIWQDGDWRVFRVKK